MNTIITSDDMNGIEELSEVDGAAVSGGAGASAPHASPVATAAGAGRPDIRINLDVLDLAMAVGEPR